jgi:hypothetical protein
MLGGEAMKNHTYSFVLKTRQGEFTGLAHAGDLLKQIGRPHFDVTRCGDESKLASHLDEIANEIKSSWAPDAEFYVDLFDIPLTWRVGGVVHPLRYLVDRLGESELFPCKVIPTTGLELERDAEYVAVAKQIALEGGLGLCLRLKPEEIDHFEQTTDAAVELLKDYRGPVELMVDYRSIVNDEPERLATRAVRMIRALEAAGLGFTQILVCSSNIPEKLSEHVAKESSWNQPRLEWRLWERVCEMMRRDDIVYGDYCVIYPEFFAPQKNPHINAKLRIADRDHYRLLRGKELYTEGGDPLQYRDLARDALELEALKELKSRAVQDLRALSVGRGGKKGSPGSIVPTEVCLHLDITAVEAIRRAEVFAGTLADA